jgi:hypothetical protein
MAHQFYQHKHQTDTLPYRLRTKRQRRRALITERDKRLIALDREQSDLYQKRRDLPWTPLDPPFMRGWKRSFVLRDDVARSKDAAFYERILEHINTVQISHRRDFKKKKRSKGKKIHVQRDQHLAKLCPYKWSKCAFSAAEAALFDIAAEFPSKPHLPFSYSYVFRDSWRFVLRVQPNMITKVRQSDAELEAALEKVTSHFRNLERNGRRDKLVCGGTYKFWKYVEAGPRYTCRRQFRNRPLHALIAEE